MSEPLALWCTECFIGWEVGNTACYQCGGGPPITRAQADALILKAARPTSNQTRPVRYCLDRMGDDVCKLRPGHPGFHQSAPAPDGTYCVWQGDTTGRKVAATICGQWWGDDSCQLAAGHDGAHRAQDDDTLITWQHESTALADPLDWDWLEDILDGIDRDECTGDALTADGWWPTSAGARFGAERLAALKAAIVERYYR